MPWVAAGIRACDFWCVAVSTGPRACRTVLCSKCDKRCSATWGLEPARITRHARTCECAPESQPIRTVRLTVASHDMQYIDLCEADNMLVNTMELELLLRKHDQLANTERICEK